MRTSSSTANASKKAQVVLLCILLTAVVLDRASLYIWRHEVLRFYLALASAPNAPAIRLAEMRPPWVSLNSDGVPVELDLVFVGQQLRPDRVRLSRGRLTLLFLPPVLAWSTRIAGLRSLNGITAYTLTLLSTREHYECRLYSGSEASGPLLTPTSAWPGIF